MGVGRTIRHHMTRDDSARDGRTTRSVEGAPLHYEVAGEGEPIVFLHGAYTSRFAFRFQRDALAADFRVILRDLRGHDGAPSVAPPGFGFDTTEIDDMLAVLQAEGLERVNLVGHSTGGTIAFLFAVKRPEFVRRVVLIEPTLLSFVPLDEWSTPVWTEALERGRRDGGRSLVEGALAELVGPDWRARMSPRSATRIEAQAGIALAHQEAWYSLDITDYDLRALRPRTLVLYGENGVPSQPHIRARMLAVRPDIEWRLIPGAGHNVHLDQPEATSAAIREFFTAS